jgi:multidrug resistance protein, MATE family
MLTEPIRLEIRDCLRLAWPMALTQVGQIGMLTTDLLMIGRLGERPLAAASLGHTVFFVAIILGMGLVSAVAPLAAQAFGARDPRNMRRALRVGLQLAVGLGIPTMLMLAWSEPGLLALGQDPETARQAARYLQGLAWCIIPSWIFIAMRGFMGALNRPEPALWITLAAIPFNALLAYALIYGAFGLPKLDLLGAGIATAIVNTLMCVAAGGVLHRQLPFRRYHPFARIWRNDIVMLRQMLSVGAPISGAFLLEFGVFAAVTLLMGTMSTAALAAHQIALQVTALVFMVPFGIAMAATVRVGHAVGRQDPQAVRRAGFTCLALTGVFMAAIALSIVAARHSIPIWFLGSADPTTQSAATLASLLLLYGASFAISDGLQTVANGALRGMNDTRVPMLVGLVSYWLVAFLLGYWLAFKAGWGATGLWAGFAAGLTVHAVLLSYRFHRLTLPAVKPDRQPTTRAHRQPANPAPHTQA